MAELGPDWRVLDGVTTAWFDAPSLVEGAALAGRLLGRSAAIAADLRATGVRVRLDADDHAGDASGAARDLGMAADPSVLQESSVAIEAADPAGVERFWQRVLAHAPASPGVLADPLRRDPVVRVRSSSEQRPWRNRLHLDVVRPGAVVEQLGLGAGSGPYGVRHADPEGNEVDLVPGGPLDERPGTEDWHAVFGAVACYRTTSATQQRDLVVAAAALADHAGFPLLVDLRPRLVVLDTGKDRWEADAHGLDVDVRALAVDLQRTARDLGAVADPALPRFVQLFLDAADVEAVRAFWTTVLGYEHDRRVGLTDVVDPRRLGPVLALQQLDVAETQRREQRDRVRVELCVPADQVRRRLDEVVGAGGRVLEEQDGRALVADPEGNELVVRGAGEIG